MERFNLKKLNEVEEYRVEIPNRFIALKDLDAEVDIDGPWETIKVNIKISAEESIDYYEVKEH
jgi:hypothetical protein